MLMKLFQRAEKPYEHSIVPDDERRILRVVVQGRITKAQGEAIITEARTTAAELKYRILCDARDAIADVKLVDWFFLPRTLGVLRDPKTRGIRTAVIVPNNALKKAYDFYETVTSNLDMRLKMFLTEDEALAWLMSGD